MFSGIFRYIKALYYKSTYRQRFIFFSLLFLTLTPLPDIWLQKIQNYQIIRKQVQLDGLQYVKVLNKLVHNVVLHQHFAVYKSNDKVIQHETLAQLENAIKQNFIALNELNEKLPQLESTSLGSGFSEIKVQKPNLSEMERLWNTILETKEFHEKAEFLKLHDDLVDAARQSLSNLGYNYGLLLNSSTLVNSLSQLNLVIIPFMQDRMVDVYDLRGIRTRDDLSKEERQTFFFVVMDKINEIFEDFKEQIATVDALLLNDKTINPADVRAIHESFTHARKSIENFLSTMDIPSDAIVNKTLIDALNNLASMSKTALSLNEELYDRELNSFYFQKYSTLILIYIGAVDIMFFIMFKVMTRHMKALQDHIDQMANGNFVKCFCSDQADEFGPIGIAFDKMGQSVQGVVGELSKLGKQLAESINQITMTAKEQEEVVAAQENSIHEIERTAQEIAVQSRDLANMMNNISLASKEYTVADSAKSGLEHMQNQMLTLSDGSSKILQEINQIHHKIIGSEALMTFMSKISDQARMLSLNSAIETANVHHQKQSFAKITQEIQRFADKTSNSIHEIQNIINEITFNVATVRVEANICVNEIKEGVGRLISVNQQLTSITNQGREQVKKFESVNDVMQVQAFAAENIIESIRKISASAMENTKSIRSLHHTTGELAITANELQRVTGLFFKEKAPVENS
jgi:methyl-accepting chemotaxis protein